MGWSLRSLDDHALDLVAERPPGDPSAERARPHSSRGFWALLTLAVVGALVSIGALAAGAIRWDGTAVAAERYVLLVALPIALLAALGLLVSVCRQRSRLTRSQAVLATAVAALALAVPGGWSVAKPVTTDSLNCGSVLSSTGPDDFVFDVGGSAVPTECPQRRADRRRLVAVLMLPPVAALGVPWLLRRRRVGA